MAAPASSTGRQPLLPALSGSPCFQHWVAAPASSTGWQPLLLALGGSPCCAVLTASVGAPSVYVLAPLNTGCRGVMVKLVMSPSSFSSTSRQQTVSTHYYISQYMCICVLCIVYVCTCVGGVCMYTCTYVCTWCNVCKCARSLMCMYTTMHTYVCIIYVHKMQVCVCVSVHVMCFHLLMALWLRLREYTSQITL